MNKFIYSIPGILIICLFVTIIIEVLLSLILKVKRSDLLIVLLVNVITNPLLNTIGYLIQYFTHINYYIYLYLAELIVFLIEGLIYKKNLSYSKISPFLLSFILNLGSYFIGKLITNVIW